MYYDKIIDENSHDQEFNKSYYEKKNKRTLFLDMWLNLKTFMISGIYSKHPQIVRPIVQE